MVKIETVTGPIDSSDIGLTLVHEHMLVRSESVFYQFPHLYDEEDDFRRAVDVLNAVKERGVKTICDPSVMDLGRNIRFIERVAKATGMQIVAATGIYTYHYLPPHFQYRSVDYMADVFVHDIEAGIQNTNMKAAFIKCATDAQGITPDVEKVLRASARAHLRTGAPIMTHTHPASGSGLMQMDIFEEEGVDPKHILIGHCGDTDSIDYLLKLLARGPYIGMDRYGITRVIATERRNATVAELCKRGFADRMMLSQDAVGSFDWFEPQVLEEERYKNWRMTFILDEILPELKRLGVTESEIRMMMSDNIRRWFEGGK